MACVRQVSARLFRSSRLVLSDVKPFLLRASLRCDVTYSDRPSTRWGIATSFSHLSQADAFQQQIRWKSTKSNSYRRPSRSGPWTRSYVNRPHLGLRALSAEYVETGRKIVNQRKYIARNVHVTRLKHFKIYPGENVRVAKDTSLMAVCSGRVKFTHDIVRNLRIANVLPEPREEIIEDDLWRYRTEHVRSMEENKVLCSLRSKAIHVFSKELRAPPQMRPLSLKWTIRKETWNNPFMQDPYEFIEHQYPIIDRRLLRRKLREGSLNKSGAVEAPKGLIIQR